MACGEEDAPKKTPPYQVRAVRLTILATAQAIEGVDDDRADNAKNDVRENAHVAREH
ncbi:hypothetical protein [Rhizobium tubonense]|uniref:hypothetical protein n=1 Tax=Rhizobium tubonense TaxID=484088 RepID=UPI0012B68329|nr:hypothetical protein [Rhizobium tubonense]